jgi:hypothetical protein
MGLAGNGGNRQCGGQLAIATKMIKQLLTRPTK